MDTSKHRHIARTGMTAILLISLAIAAAGIYPIIHLTGFALTANGWGRFLSILPLTAAVTIHGFAFVIAIHTLTILQKN